MSAPPDAVEVGKRALDGTPVPPPIGSVAGERAIEDVPLLGEFSYQCLAIQASHLDLVLPGFDRQGDVPTGRSACLLRSLSGECVEAAIHIQTARGHVATIHSLNGDCRRLYFIRSERVRLGIATPGVGTPNGGHPCDQQQANQPLHPQ